MGLGARCDTLDDFCGYSNWRKVTNYGMWYCNLFLHINSSLVEQSGNSMLKKMLKAIPEAINHWRAFEEFDTHLRSDRLAQVIQWEVEYEGWVKEPTGLHCIFDTSDPGE
jgi:hypothetical protein